MQHAANSVSTQSWHDLLFNGELTTAGLREKRRLYNDVEGCLTLQKALRTFCRNLKFKSRSDEQLERGV